MKSLAKREQLKRVRLLRRLPKRFTNCPAEYLPADLKGATIVAIGSPSDQSLVDGGGLFIDYAPLGGGNKRIVLAFDETAMWVVQCD